MIRSRPSGSEPSVWLKSPAISTEWLSDRIDVRVESRFYKIVVEGSVERGLVRGEETIVACRTSWIQQ